MTPLDQPKTHEDISELADIIQKEADNLPGYSDFEEDNSESIQEGNDLAQALRRAALGYPVLNEEIKSWIAGKPSSLNDYFM